VKPKDNKEIFDWDSYIVEKKGSTSSVTKLPCGTSTSDTKVNGKGDVAEHNVTSLDTLNELCELACQTNDADTFSAEASMQSSLDFGSSSTLDNGGHLNGEKEIRELCERFGGDDKNAAKKAEKVRATTPIVQIFVFFIFSTSI